MSPNEKGISTAKYDKKLYHFKYSFEYAASILIKDVLFKNQVTEKMSIKTTLDVFNILFITIFDQQFQPQILS